MRLLDDFFDPAPHLLWHLQIRWKGQAIPEPDRTQLRRHSQPLHNVVLRSVGLEHSIGHTAGEKELSCLTHSQEGDAFQCQDLHVGAATRSNTLYLEQGALHCRPPRHSAQCDSVARHKPVWIGPARPPSLTRHHYLQVVSQRLRSRKNDIVGIRPLECVHQDRQIAHGGASRILVG